MAAAWPARVSSAGENLPVTGIEQMMMMIEQHRGIERNRRWQRWDVVAHSSARTQHKSLRSSTATVSDMKWFGIVFFWLLFKRSTLDDMTTTAACVVWLVSVENGNFERTECKIVDWFVVVVAGAVIVHFDALPQTGEMQGMAGHRPGKDAGDIRGIRHKDGFDDFCVMP